MMTDKNKTRKPSYATGGFAGFHAGDNPPMTPEQRERLNKAFQVFIATVGEQERIKKLKQEELHGDH